jgi:branched-chain amino acid transport system substrate-binding protein
MGDKGKPRGRRRILAFAVTACLAMAACGTHVTRAEVEAAAGVGTTSSTQRTGTADASSAGVASVAGAPVAGGAASSSGGAAAEAGTPTASGGGGSAAAQGPVTPAGTRTANLSPVRLGHIGTYSGLLGAIFNGGREMAQVWASWVNSHGGLNGHPVQVVTGDDGGDPARNLALTREMVENQGVIGFVGNIVPLSVNGSRAYLESKGIPVIGGDLTDVGWYQSPMLFPQGALIDGSLRGSARVAVQSGGPRVALLYCGEAAACFRARDLFQQGAVSSAGGQLVYTAQVSLAQPDFTAECIQLRSNKVDAVVATVDGNSLSRLARACAQQNVKVKYVSFSLALVDSLRSDPNLDGLVGTSGLFPWMLKDGPAADYARAIATYAPTLNTSGSTAAVWGSGLLVQAAGRNLPAGAPKASDLLDGLYALKGETLGGLAPPLTFRRGQPPAPVYCYFTITLKGGQFSSPTGLNMTC